MVANSPIESNTLLNSHALDVHQYKNPWQAFNNMVLPDDIHDTFDTNHPEYMQLT